VGRNAGVRRGRIMAVVAALAWLALGLAWSLASPPGSSPDDDFHLGSIWCAWGREATGCVEGAIGETRVDVQVPALQQAFSNCVALKPEASAACQFASQGPPPTTANTGLYPPGYYSFLRLFATDNLAGSIVAMRMAVWTVCTALWAGLLLIIPNPSRYRILLAALAAFVPLGLFLSASTNPSGLVVTTIPVAVLAVAFAGDFRRRRGAAAVGLAAVAGVAAVVTRSDAPFLLALGLAAVLLLRVRDWRTVGSWWPAPAAVAASVVLGLLIAGTQTSNISGGLPGADGTASGAGPSIGSVVTSLPTYFIGGFATTLGYMDVPMPAVVWAPVAAVMAAIAVLGLTSWRLEKGLAVLVVVLGQVVGLVYLQVGSACCTVQARYFLPLTVIWMALLALVPAGATAWRLNVPQAWVLGLGLVVSQSIALHQVLVRYTVGLGTPGDHLWLRDGQWWWAIPIPPLAVWLVGSAGFACAVAWALSQVVRPAEGQPVVRVAATTGTDQ